MRVAVIGAGNGGHAMAAHLTVEGHEAVLFSRTASKIEDVERQGGIVMHGAGADGLVPIAGATSDIAAAIADAEIIVSTVPGMVQPDYVELLVPHIRPEQALWFCPGNTMSLIARPLLAAAGKEDVLLIESNTLTYAVRKTAPASVKVTYLLLARCAAFPARRNEEAMGLVRRLYPLPAAPNVLDTTLNNVNPMIHVVPSLLNMGSIDAREGLFSIYGEGMTESVLRTMGALDAERLALLEHLGLDAMRLDELYEELGTGPIYRESMGVGAADRYEPRFLSEDVPVGLVTMASLAREHGTPAGLIEALIEIACIIDQVDYRSMGRTSAELGLEGMSVERLGEYLHEGRVG
jgi:opine dehydrogenase